MFKMNNPVPYACPRTFGRHEPLQVLDIGVFMTEGTGSFVTRLEARSSRNDMLVVDEGPCGDWRWREGLWWGP